MKVAIVADKKAGHLSQCLGLRDILKKQSHTDLEVLSNDETSNNS